MIRPEKEILLMAIGDRIRMLREEKGISQRQLAALTGIKQPAIARLESGRSVPNITTMNKLLAPLGYTLTISQLLDE